MSSDKASRAYASIVSQLAQWDDHENDEVENNRYVSKRQSGAFSPMATATATAATPGEGSMGAGENMGSPIESATPMTVKKSVFLRSVPSPVETPMMQMNTSPMRTPATAASVNVNNIRNLGSNTKTYTGRGAPFDSTMKTAMPSFAAHANLDGDYRPYHDALVALLDKTNVANANSLQNKQARSRFIQRLAFSTYSRSTLLGNSGTESYMGDHGKTKRGLETEGHFWALIGKLAEQADDESSAKDGNFLLYQSGSPSNTNLFNSNSARKIQREIELFVQQMVQQNDHLDAAGMMDLMEQCLRGEIDDIPIPAVLKRRQMILEWIQSCHNRSVSPSFFDNSNKENVMWKDTTEKLNREQHSAFPSASTSFSTSNGKIQEIHPDAPLLKPRFGNEPLYGKDNEREIDLLQSCLLLIKAGRMQDVWELCTRMGQPWRAASWNGNDAFGHVEVENGVARVGNPHRALWKRNMWEVSQSLHSMLQSQSQSKYNFGMGGNGMNTSNLSGSIVYEAAISAILADDTQTASRNPLLSKDWMDLVWLFYRGLQARVMELTFHTHNNGKRAKEKADEFPFEGSDPEYVDLEKEQLLATQDMEAMEEGGFLGKLQGQSSTDEWGDGIRAFLTGINDAQNYMSGIMETLIQLSASGGQASAHMETEEYEQLLRFILHLVLFFDSFCFTNELSTTENQNTVTLSSFHQSFIAPRRNQLVHAYLQELMAQEPLWEFTSLYASLLPQDELKATCADFWSTCVFEEKDRRMVLKHARDNFEDGMDLDILRNVVRASIQLQSESIEIDSLQTLSWLGSAAHGERCDADLEGLISKEDVWRIHSIRWLCFHNEHYADALVCANMLLRSLLLELPSYAGEKEGDAFNDWSDNVKLYTAKVLQARILPLDIVELAQTSMGSDDSGWNVEEYAAEYGALQQFFDAHNGYQGWKECIEETPPDVPFSHDARFSAKSVESEVAMKMKMMKYCKDKKELARRLVKYAEVAMDSLMEVFEYNNGWMFVGDDGVDNDSAMRDESDELSLRRKEMNTIRAKCLPAALSLAFRVCYYTSAWMDEFTKDVLEIFGKNDVAEQVLSSITEHDAMGSDGGINDVGNPFEAVTWLRRALLLENTVASSEAKVSECMSKEDVSTFMECMAEAETNIALLNAQQDVNQD